MLNHLLLARLVARSVHGDAHTVLVEALAHLWGVGLYWGSEFGVWGAQGGGCTRREAVRCTGGARYRLCNGVRGVRTHLVHLRAQPAEHRHAAQPPGLLAL